MNELIYTEREIEDYKQDIKLARRFIQRIRANYGSEKCEEKDLEDPEIREGVANGTCYRCCVCEAHEIVDWIEEHFIEFMEEELISVGVDPEV